jgi:pyrimidine deaminase RibD-like protein/RNA-binding protein YhbY
MAMRFSITSDNSHKRQEVTLRGPELSPIHRRRTSISLFTMITTATVWVHMVQPVAKAWSPSLPLRKRLSNMFTASFSLDHSSGRYPFEAVSCQKRAFSSNSGRPGDPIHSRDTLRCPTSRLYSTTQETPESPTTAAIDSTVITSDDIKFMQMAVQYARQGFGHTFPNPAVGCVLVETMDPESSQASSETAYTATTDAPESSDPQLSNKASSNNHKKIVIGAGFHPRAGYPHAEVFALLEAAGHLKSGVEAAQAVIQYSSSNATSAALVTQVHDLLDVYCSKQDGQGPAALLHDIFRTLPHPRHVTAYVTLEPCCGHVGKQTPPCASSLVMAGIQRVVVGARDPNPGVNGGGVEYLLQQDIVVDTLGSQQTLHATKVSNQRHVVQKECQDLICNFGKRMVQGRPEEITGGMRRALRGLANQLKSQSRLTTVHWSNNNNNSGGKSKIVETEEDIMAVTLVPEWMEHVDSLLWNHELVLLRLNTIVKKKKMAQYLGERIAHALQAHLAQTLGHSVLLYRPGQPPVLDLHQLLADYKSKHKDDASSSSTSDSNMDDE